MATGEWEFNDPKIPRYGQRRTVQGSPSPFEYDPNAFTPTQPGGTPSLNDDAQWADPSKPPTQQIDPNSEYLWDSAMSRWSVMPKAGTGTSATPTNTGTPAPTGGGGTTAAPQFLPPAPPQPQPAPAAAPAEPTSQPFVDGGRADPNQNPFASHPAGGVWIESTGQWVPGDHPMATMGGAPSYGSSASTSSSTTAGTSRPGNIEDAYRAAILQLLQAPQDVDPNKLRNSPEMQARQLQSQRAEERDRQALAERASAGGWSATGGFEGGLNALRQTRGESDMAFMGELAATYMERQREDLRNGIEFALNDRQFNLAQQLERELANLDAAIQREQIAANVGMNDAELGVRSDLGHSDLDLRRYLGELDSSYNFANLEMQGNRDALLYGSRPSYYY